MGVLCFFPSRVMRSPHKALLRCALEKNTRAPGLEMLKGQPGTSRIGSKPLNRTVGAFLAPTGRNVYLGLPRVNPGLAMLSCPCGAGPSGCMTGAKHIRVIRSSGAGSCHLQITEVRCQRKNRSRFSSSQRLAR